MIFLRQMVKCWQWGIGKTIAATVAAHSNSISVGLCQGFSAVLLPQLKTDTTLGPSMTDEHTSWIASLGVISNPLGALLAGLMMEILGRKTTIKLTALPYLIGWILIAFSDTIVKLYFGRFITGLAVGMATASYVYVAEISPSEHRGILSASGPVHVSLGVLVVYILGAICHWQYVAAWCSLTAIFSFVVMCTVPESPAWLVTQGRISEASDALMWLRSNPNLVDKELKELQQSNPIKLGLSDEDNNNNQNKTQTHLQIMLQKHIWKPFVILVLLFSFQGGSGIYIILYYAVSFFQEVGAGFNEYAASIVVACMRLIMSIIGAILIKNFGRRTLTIVSGLGMSVSMVLCGTYEHYYYHKLPEERPMEWAPLVFILMHVCLSMVGFLQIPWVMTGELFPLKVRGIMGGIVSSIAHMLIFTSIKTYIYLLAYLGMDGTLWVFSLTALCGATYCYMFLPETKDRTLREIEYTFKHGSSPEQEIDIYRQNATGKQVFKIELFDSIDNAKAYNLSPAKYQNNTLRHI